MNSFKQMIKNGDIKRADAMRMRVEDIHVEPGFNLRLALDEEEEASLLHHISQGGKYPPLEVRPREDGGVWIVDGHRRHRNILQAIKNGCPIEWVPVVAFEGNDADRTLRVLSSQENMKLTPLEVAMGYKRLLGFGWTVERIAQERGRSRAHVEQLLLLAHSNSDVQNAVKEGKVSASLAVELLREHGTGAGAVIESKPGKVTPKTVRKKLNTKQLVEWCRQYADGMYVGDFKEDLQEFFK